ncbi:MAG: 30S ribosomal protein S7 [Planctomycetota bacterium]|nr:30S ribosomal protein S7 [Planctomycetota bacterium]
MPRKSRFGRKPRVPEPEVPALPTQPKVTGRGLKPDTRYNDLLVSTFINSMMRKGKKTVSQRVFYAAMQKVGEKTGANALEVFNAALNNVKPVVEVKSKRVGGATYQVPVEVNRKRAQSLAIRWILEAARGKKGRPMADRLAGELLDAYKKEGAAITKRENTHKMAEANKAFAHYAW